MKKLIIASTFILIGLVGYSQKKYSTNSEYSADVKVYVVNSEYAADLKVYKVSSEYNADGNKGLWFFTDSEYSAQKKIYFVDSEYAAGWREASKKHLMY